MIRTSQWNQRILTCALIGGLALTASAWAGPFAGGGFGAGGFGSLGAGRNVAAGDFGAGGFGSLGAGRNVAAAGEGQADGQLAHHGDAPQRVGNGVNASMQSQAEAARRVDTSANPSASASASPRPGRATVSGSADGQADAQAGLSR